MFDISFSELVLITIVFILFVSPKKIPTLAKSAGQFSQKIKQFIFDVKEEIGRDEKFKELKKIQRELKKSSTKNK
ncbi:MAG: twin-arginine translocase TatA/TatE family subunit [Methylophilaceae bacterium]|jgi:Tat protein translocase TatB subunit